MSSPVYYGGGGVSAPTNPVRKIERPTVARAPDFADLDSGTYLRKGSLLGVGGTVYRATTDTSIGNAFDPTDFMAIAGGTGAATGVANTFTAAQTVQAPTSGTGSPNHALRLLADTTDAGTNLRLGNITPGQVASGGLAFFRPDVQFEIDNLGRRWSPIAVDVGPSIGLGVGSRNGGANTGFGDLVIGYRRDPVDASFSQDFIYMVDERNGRIGIMDNNPAAQLQLSKHQAGLPAMIINDLAEASWALKFQRSATDRGGFYMPSTGTYSGFLHLKLGTNVAVPAEVLDIGGFSVAHGYKLLSGAITDYVLEANQALIHATGSGGSGVYPFNAPGHLILAGRQVTATTTGDIILATGRDAFVPVIVAHGGSSATRNVSINPDPAAPTALSAGGVGILGLRNGTGPANAAAASRPAAGVALWAVSSTFRIMEPAGGVVALGNVGGASGTGINMGAFASNTLDARLARIAAGVIETDSILRYNAAGSWQTTVGAAGAASALPATPTKYLKVRDEAGTSLVIPAYVAS